MKRRTALAQLVTEVIQVFIWPMQFQVLVEELHLV